MIAEPNGGDGNLGFAEALRRAEIAGPGSTNILTGLWDARAF